MKKNMSLLMGFVLVTNFVFANEDINNGLMPFVDQQLMSAFVRSTITNGCVDNVHVEAVFNVDSPRYMCARPDLVGGISADDFLRNYFIPVLSDHDNEFGGLVNDNPFDRVKQIRDRRFLVMRLLNEAFEN